ncbi:hypothetical protein FACS1894170_13690 [Planctomycetales bacterium]|nr:hypothetical protein FACS1894170_13690 [Planctomycetales bacterium]
MADGNTLDRCEALAPPLQVGQYALALDDDLLAPPPLQVGQYALAVP